MSTKEQQAHTATRRFKALYEAALNLGMSEKHARFYAEQALAAELATGEAR